MLILQCVSVEEKIIHRKHVWSGRVRPPPPLKMQIYKIHVAISPKIGLGPPWQILLSIKPHPPEKKILNPRMKLRG